MPLLAQGHSLEPPVRKTRMVMCQTKFFLDAINAYDQPTRYKVVAFRTKALLEPVEITSIPDTFMLAPKNRTRFIVSLKDYEDRTLYVCTQSVPDKANQESVLISRVCSKVEVYASPNHNDIEWCAAERERRDGTTTGRSAT